MGSLEAKVVEEGCADTRVLSLLFWTDMGPGIRLKVGGVGAPGGLLEMEVMEKIMQMVARVAVAVTVMMVTTSRPFQQAWSVMLMEIS